MTKANDLLWKIKSAAQDEALFDCTDGISRARYEEAGMQLAEAESDLEKLFADLECPKKVPRNLMWKQDTPRMQVAGLLQAAWGDVHNYVEGRTTSKEGLKRALHAMENIQQIMKNMPEGEWE